MDSHKNKITTILGRLLNAKSIITGMKEEKMEASMIRDALNIGTSQLNLLKSWSTDKDDKNPLIRTMDYTSSGFPFIAKNNEQLRKFPSAYIAKKRENGILSNENLKDARLKHSVRVKRNAVTWWLEHGDVCDDEVLESVKFINSANIRRCREYESVVFKDIGTGSSALTRKRIDTEEPVIRITGRRANFFGAVFEGEAETLKLPGTDRKNLEFISSKILNFVQDPDEIVRIVRKMTDSKPKYIPTNKVYSIAAIELRHALESNHWQVQAEGLSVSGDDETRILKIACGVLIYNALFSGGAAKLVLTQMLQKTFIGNDSLESLLNNRTTYSEILMSVCQAAIGKPIIVFNQLFSVVFVKTNFISKYAGLSDQAKKELMEKRGYKGDYFEKLVVYNKVTYTTYTKDKEITVCKFKVPLGITEYHLSYLSTSAEIKVEDGKLVNGTFQTKDIVSSKHMISSAIIFLGLFGSNLPVFEAESEFELKLAMFKYFSNHENWPFKKRNFQRVHKEDEFMLKDIPLYDEIQFMDKEATSYNAVTRKCVVDETTLEVGLDLGYGESEKYSKTIIHADTIKQSAKLAYDNHKILPKEVYSLHPELINKLGVEQVVVRFFLEVFCFFLKEPIISQSRCKLDNITQKQMNRWLELSDEARDKLEDFKVFLKRNYRRDDLRTAFAIYVITTLINNFHSEESPTKSRKVRVQRHHNELTINCQIFRMNIPNWETGNCKILPNFDFKAGEELLFNLQTGRVIMSTDIFNFPVLEDCTMNVDHEQLRGASINDLAGQIGKHVILVGRCFIVKNYEKRSTITDLIDTIDSNQVSAQHLIGFEMQDDVVEEDQEDPMDFDEL